MSGFPADFYSFSGVGAVHGHEERDAVCQVYRGAFFAADDRSYV
ncbi:MULTISPECIES: hypothetical protein [Pseudomonas]|nr:MULTISPECIES: hypothetical protein [Pseudomonas]